MSYYWFNRQELLQKAKKEKKMTMVVKKSKDVIKEKANSKHNNLTKEEKEAKK